MNPDLSEATFQSILQAIASGTPVKAALELHGVTRYDYDKARAKNPLNSAAHTRARQDGVDAMADEVPHIADTEADPQKARNRIEARKWLAGVVKPREYGQRLDLTVTQAGNPAELHDEGMRRARLMRDSAIELLPQLVDGEQVYATNATDGQSVPAASPSIWD